MERGVGKLPEPRTQKELDANGGRFPLNSRKQYVSEAQPWQFVHSVLLHNL